MTEQALEAFAQIQKQGVSAKPRIGLALGSGQGQVVDAIAIEQRFAYTALPGFPDCFGRRAWGRVDYW